MESTLPQVHYFCLRSADVKTQTAFFQHVNRMDHEMLANDPPAPVENQLLSVRKMPEHINIYVWSIWKDEDVVATSRVRVISDAPNPLMK